MFRFLRRLFFRNSPNTLGSSLAKPAEWLTALFSPISKSGVEVSDKTALSLTALYRAVSIIAESIASIPFEVIEDLGERGVRVAREHPLFYLIHDEPSPLYTSFMFRLALVANAVRKGNGYAYIARDNSGRPVQLVVIDPSAFSVKSFTTPTGELYYRIEGLPDNFPFIDRLRGLVSSADMIHIPGLSLNGVSGMDITELHRENFGFALASRDYGNYYYRNGAHTGGYLKHAATLSDEAYKRIQTSWNRAYQGIDKTGLTPILEEGTEFVQMGTDPDKAQMLPAQRFAIEDISRITGVPMHMLSSLERATFSNIEQQSYEFAVFCVRPWVERIEAEFSRKVFRQTEKGRFRVRLNMNAFLRGDSESRADLYRALFQSGALSPNDILKSEGMNPIPDGDRRFVPMNMIPLDRVDDIVPAPADPGSPDSDTQNQPDNGVE